MLPRAVPVPVRPCAVRVTTIDSYCTDRENAHVDFIRIDTEGAELSILRGAEECLGPDGARPVPMLEVSVPVGDGGNPSPSGEAHSATWSRSDHEAWGGGVVSDEDLAWSCRGP